MGKELQRIIDTVCARVFFKVLYPCVKSSRARAHQGKRTWSKALIGLTKMMAFASSKYGTHEWRCPLAPPTSKRCHDTLFPCISTSNICSATPIVWMRACRMSSTNVSQQWNAINPLEPTCRRYIVSSRDASNII